MKNLKTTLVLVTTFMIVAVTGVSAQHDDLYFDPAKDGKSSNEVYYDDMSSPKNEALESNTNERKNNQDNKPDGSSGYSDDSYDDYDDYDYYYSSRIRRFNRPFYGFGYFDDCYVSSFNYDPFWTGTTIYVGFDSYRDYRRWRRFNNYNYWNNWGPTYSWGWGYNPWGWNTWNSWGNPYSPWGWNAYSPCAPYGNIYINNIYYGNNWGWNGGGWNGHHDGGYYNEYTNNVHYGPRRSGGSITELKGNPRGRFAPDVDNPRAISNQGPKDANSGRINNNNNGGVSRPDRVQSTDLPSRPTRPSNTEVIPNKPDRVQKDAQKQDQPVRPDRPVIKRDQQDSKPYIPKDVDRPSKKEDQPQRPKRDNNRFADGQSEDEYLFDSQKPSRPNKSTGEESVNEERTQRPERREREYNMNTRPQRQESAPKPSFDQGSYRQKAESPAPRSNFGGGSSNSSSRNNSSGGGESKRSNPRGK